MLSKISVILPVYNTERYLKDCLDSIVNQTLEDLEIICVDDGSTDGSLKILEDYAARDSRIVLIPLDPAKKTDLGAATARNTGLRRAGGQYIYFMDSDDYLDLEALEYVYNQAVADQLDVIYFDAELVYETEALAEEYKNRRYLRTESFDQVQTGLALMQILRKKRQYTCPLWAELLRREFLEDNHIVFEEGHSHDDVVLNFKISLHAQRVSHRQKTLYYRRYRENSLSTRVWHFEEFHSSVFICVALERYAKKFAAEYPEQYNTYRETIGEFCQNFVGSAKVRLETIPQEEKTWYLERFTPEELAFFEEKFFSSKRERAWLMSPDAQRQQAKERVVQRKRGKCYRAIRCLRENGLRYTAKRFFEKLDQKIKFYFLRGKR